MVGIALLIVVENRAASNCDASAGNYETNKKVYEHRFCFSLSFSILTGGESTEATYREYQIALRNFNYQLLLLKQVLALTSDLSSYTARHTWATTAYYCEIHPGIISEAMGHSSITVTETYLKPFRNKKIDEANKQVLDFVKRSVIGVSA